jgi:hypothetical protein
MTLQFSVTVRNARLDAIPTAIGASPVLKIRTGAPPANCAAADTGSLLASAQLPSTWLSDAADGVISKSGPWTDPSSDASGDAGHFRIDAGGLCQMQGTVTATGGGGDMTVAEIEFTAGRAFSITGFAITENNG